MHGLNTIVKLNVEAQRKADEAFNSSVRKPGDPVRDYTGAGKQELISK
jgi:hypothetical protein